MMSLQQSKLAMLGGSKMSLYKLRKGSKRHFRFPGIASDGGGNVPRLGLVHIFSPPKFLPLLFASHPPEYDYNCNYNIKSEKNKAEIWRALEKSSLLRAKDFGLVVPSNCLLVSVF